MKLPFKKYAPSKNYGWIITIRKLLSEIKIYTKSIAYVGWTVRKLRAGSKRITVGYHAIVGQRMRRGGLFVCFVFEGGGSRILLLRK
jgi:hypothetical protein